LRWRMRLIMEAIPCGAALSTFPWCAKKEAEPVVIAQQDGPSIILFSRDCAGTFAKYSEYCTILQ